MLQNELMAKFMNVFEMFTQAFKIIDNDHAYIHEGIMFVAFDKLVVSSGQTGEYAFKTPPVGYVHYRLAGINTGADKVDTQIYEDADYTGGTLLNINNKNRNSDNVSGTVISKNPVFSSPGTLLPGFSSYLPGAESGGQRRSGTDGGSDSEIVFKQDTVYRFVLTNGSTATNTVGINLRWYEEMEG